MLRVNIALFPAKWGNNFMLLLLLSTNFKEIIKWVCNVDEDVNECVKPLPVYLGNN